MLNPLFYLLESEPLKNLFLELVNTSISAGWLILAIILLRGVLKSSPKWAHVLLWGIAAIRLLCPFSIESPLSLIPSTETIPMNIEMAAKPAIDSGIGAVDRVINPVIAASFTPVPMTSMNPLQLWIPVAAVVWLLGVIIMAIYTAVSYSKLRRHVAEAVLYRDNIFQSENIDSPFVLGILRPRIYLPFRISEDALPHIIAHEQAHIRRKDHWWKPLGFLLLTVHWFNPLMWVAYILLCRDIELACDERVIMELSNEQRADYTQALVACSINRHVIAACPLAFGEVGVKERVKSVMNYKKPAFWLVASAVATCIIVAICFLTNPAAEREFPINGRNVSTLDTERVVEMIAKAEKLDDGSQLCVNDDNFDLMFTSNFEWANDGAIRFFYLKNQETYSAQLRMFHDDNKYFITDSSDWVEQEQFFKLFHYLDALKYMPQEEIRKLSPDADGFSVYMRNDGVPGDYERVLKYSQDGVEDINGWYIHLEVQPLHEVEGGAYNGSGDELIHLFYGHPDLVMLENNSVTKWFDYLETPEKMPGDGRLEINLPEFQDVTFRWYPGKIETVTEEEIVPLFHGMPIWNTYFCDLTGDGIPDLCSTYTFGSGIIDSRIIIYDYANGASYELSDRGNFDFVLRFNEADGYLYVDKTKYNTDELVESGRLVFKDDCLQIEGFSSNTDERNGEWDMIPMVMVDGELYLDTGRESSLDARCGVMDGEITSSVDGGRPTENNQSNFGTGYGYQRGTVEGTIEILIDGKWWIYATEEARHRLQFPTDGSDLLDIFRSSLEGSETTLVTDYVYAEDNAYGLKGVVQYTDETGAPWKLAFILDDFAYPAAQDWGGDYAIASRLSYLGGGKVKVYVEHIKDGTFYECTMTYSYDEAAKQTNFVAESHEVTPMDNQWDEIFLHMGLNAEIIDIDEEAQILYVKDTDPSANIFGERCGLVCTDAAEHFNLLYVNYGGEGDVRTIDFSEFTIGDSVIVTLAGPDTESAYNGVVFPYQVQLGTQRIE